MPRLRPSSSKVASMVAPIVQPSTTLYGTIQFAQRTCRCKTPRQLENLLTPELAVFLDQLGQLSRLDTGEPNLFRGGLRHPGQRFEKFLVRQVSAVCLIATQIVGLTMLKLNSPELLYANTACFDR